jgi:acetyl-CoA carboxylase, biotin carboxylase subunit
MIQKILIANRGEIALRIVRACRELGIKTLAVYSEADVQSLHVQLADEAICIGGPRSSDSYLRADRIISAAEIADVDAIHPGYGFLSENADFAEQCESCNIKFIGPKSTVDQDDGRQVRRQGHRPQGRRADRARFSDGPVDQSEAEAVKVARKIGYPVIIKAVAGGGGRGMRIAHNDVSFAKEFHVARNEAEKAFGNGASTSRSTSRTRATSSFRSSADPRQGHPPRRARLLGPAPPPEADRGIALAVPHSPTCARRWARPPSRPPRRCEYENAGTIEFLVDEKGNFYFIEMNTRIQVEHPVTEESPASTW